MSAWLIINHHDIHLTPTLTYNTNLGKVRYYKFGYQIAFAMDKDILPFSVGCSIWIVLEFHQLHIEQSNHQSRPMLTRNNQLYLVLKKIDWNIGFIPYILQYLIRIIFQHVLINDLYLPCNSHLPTTNRSRSVIHLSSRCPYHNRLLLVHKTRRSHQL